MKMTLVSAAALLLAGLAQVVLAERPGKVPGDELAALEQKMVAAWKGQSPCAGNFVFRADGTYELREYGPAPYDSLGTWAVRWDALPPTLVLTCTASESPDEVGRSTEMKLLQLDGECLAVRHGKQTVNRYARVKK